eukprot:2242893-Amphidinium_carterae.1
MARGVEQIKNRQEKTSLIQGTSSNLFLLIFEYIYYEHMGPGMGNAHANNKFNTMNPRGPPHLIRELSPKLKI